MRHIFFFFLLPLTLLATPTSLFWTNCTTVVLDTGTLHFGVSNYFTPPSGRGKGQILPPDISLTYGLFCWEGVMAEVGIDYLAASNDPVFFNGKIGIQEDYFFQYMPSLNIGIFGVGTNTRGSLRTNQNIVDVILGRSLPSWLGEGSVYVAGFSGGSAMGKNQQGFMVGAELKYCHVVDCLGTEYYKWLLLADYASGKNVIGGGGFALQYNFTPYIYIITGPAWFNDAYFNGKWKWSIQLAFNLPDF